MEIGTGAQGRRHRRQEFGEFLRARRERTDPRELGLVVAGHRRTPGLRREEIALLAGMSVDYYTRLEQGRDLQPSSAVIDALARALQLGPAERDHLFRLSGTEPAVRRTEPVEVARPSVLRLLDALLPNPAILTGPRLNVLGWNRACAALLVDFGALPPDRRNLARLIFSDARARDIYGDWERAARDCLGALRGAVGRFPEDARLRALVEDLQATSPEFDQLWGRHDVKERASGSKEFVHPAIGRFTLDYEALGVGDSDQMLLVYSAPEGSAAQASIEMLASLAPRG